MSAELVLAAIGAADLCLTYGKKLVGLYQDFKNAYEIVTEKILLVEAIWSRTAIQVEFVKRVAHTLEEEHCRIHIQVFEMLRSKLMIATTKLESTVNKAPGSGVKKWKLLFIREGLEEILAQLELWQRIFDPTWYLILRMSDSLIDSELPKKPDESTSSSLSSAGTLVDSPNSTLSTAKSFRNILRKEVGLGVHISLPQDGLDWKNAAHILYSTTRVIQRTGSTKQYIVDTITCDSGLDLALARQDAETLAKTLQQVNPEVFGLPVCYGLVKRRDFETRQISSMNLVFLMPPAKGIPTTLRQCLMQCPQVSLTEVLDVARQLAKAISFIHACNFVHKNVRPETILLFPDETGDGKVSLGTAYLLGFDSFRSINFQTLFRGDVAWERNLYRHPSRQGLRSQDKYIMQHDVYSLGVCLLEIGLWGSFVTYEADAAGVEGVNVNKLPSERLGLKAEHFETQKSDSSTLSSLTKDHLVSLAKSKLPMRMGDKYTAVVVTCLTCMDEGNDDFGDENEMQDEDGILIGVRFIEKVLFRLSEISF